MNREGLIGYIVWRQGWGGGEKNSKADAAHHLAQLRGAPWLVHCGTPFRSEWQIPGVGGRILGVQIQMQFISKRNNVSLKTRGLRLEVVLAGGKVGPQSKLREVYAPLKKHGTGHQNLTVGGAQP